ncbi:uncharacterized protein [Periplaneta americana]|uniref:uncharacterized protein isoform X2 n=1 Tax=Periplaneta americana TaxID=6978 RepID=UPI0037E83350
MADLYFFVVTVVFLSMKALAITAHRYLFYIIITKFHFLFIGVGTTRTNPNDLLQLSANIPEMTQTWTSHKSSVWPGMSPLPHNKCDLTPE